MADISMLYPVATNQNITANDHNTQNTAIANINTELVRLPIYRILGDGSDGVGKTGVISNPTQTPTVTQVAGGRISGPRFYWFTFGNLSGETAFSNASGDLNASSHNGLVSGWPTSGVANAQWVNIYASATLDGTKVRVGRVKFGVASFLDISSSLSGYLTHPNGGTNNTNLIATNTGSLYLDSLELGTAGQGINVGATGNEAGILELYINGNLSLSNGAFINGEGAFNGATGQKRSIWSAINSTGIGSIYTNPVSLAGQGLGTFGRWAHHAQGGTKAGASIRIVARTATIDAGCFISADGFQGGTLYSDSANVLSGGGRIELICLERLTLKNSSILRARGGGITSAAAGYAFGGGGGGYIIYGAPVIEDEGGQILVTGGSGHHSGTTTNGSFNAAAYAGSGGTTVGTNGSVGTIFRLDMQTGLREYLRGLL